MSVTDQLGNSEPTRKRGMRTWLLAWLPVALWAVIVFVFSEIPGSRYPRFSIPHLDKVAHLCIFAALGFLSARAASNTLRARPMTVVIVAVIVGTLYGVLDEYHQLSTPNRSGGDLGDTIADALGALVGGLTYVAWSALRSSRGGSRGAAAPPMN